MFRGIEFCKFHSLALRCLSIGAIALAVRVEIYVLRTLPGTVPGTASEQRQNNLRDVVLTC